MSSARTQIEQDIHPTIVTDPDQPRVTVYCIDTCSTCKTARKDLEAAGYAVFWHDVKGKDMGFDDWQSIEEAVGWEAMVNKQSQTWRKLSDADKEGLNRETALELLVANPTLMKRPVIDCGDRMTVGWTDEVKAQYDL